ncbi:hypothetical protein NUW58_g9434 [Xylaria curta]|uniref:Uncharacterized protein n=1 Tax=Xylaria curta TaxID=42375 RepID=A0ACC1MWI4_9PEZI|nr:hypothetical protein NUW58_g9434 [Xylaria curta]
MRPFVPPLQYTKGGSKHAARIPSSVWGYGRGTAGMSWERGELMPEKKPAVHRLTTTAIDQLKHGANTTPYQCRTSAQRHQVCESNGSGGRVGRLQHLRLELRILYVHSGNAEEHRDRIEDLFSWVMCVAVGQAVM